MPGPTAIPKDPCPALTNQRSPHPERACLETDEDSAVQEQEDFMTSGRHNNSPPHPHPRMPTPQSQFRGYVWLYENGELKLPLTAWPRTFPPWPNVITRSLSMEGEKEGPEGYLKLLPILLPSKRPEGARQQPLSQRLKEHSPLTSETYCELLTPNSKSGVVLWHEFSVICDRSNRKPIQYTKHVFLSN